MLLVEQPKAIVSGIDSKDFSMKFNSHVAKLLSDNIYENKGLAVVRELCTNAYDANLETPFRVVPPTFLNKNLTIRDYGTGLTESEIYSLYTTYFSSGSLGDSDKIGGFGLGSKAPLALTDSFIVNSYQGGKMSTYSIYKDAGMPKVSKISCVDTEEADGLEVSVAIPDNSIGKVSGYVAKICINLVAKNGEIPILPESYATENSYHKDHIVPFDNGHRILAHSKMPQMYDHQGITVMLNNVQYPVNMTNMSGLGNLRNKYSALKADAPAEDDEKRMFSALLDNIYILGLQILADPSKVTPSVSRESLSMEEGVQEYLLEAIFRAIMVQTVRLTQEHKKASRGDSCTLDSIIGALTDTSGSLSDLLLGRSLFKGLGTTVKSDFRVGEQYADPSAFYSNNLVRLYGTEASGGEVHITKLDEAYYSQLPREVLLKRRDSVSKVTDVIFVIHPSDSPGIRGRFKDSLKTYLENTEDFKATNYLVVWIGGHDIRLPKELKLLKSRVNDTSKYLLNLFDTSNKGKSGNYTVKVGGKDFTVRVVSSAVVRKPLSTYCRRSVVGGGERASTVRVVESLQSLLGSHDLPTVAEFKENFANVRTSNNTPEYLYLPVQVRSTKNQVPKVSSASDINNILYFVRRANNGSYTHEWSENSINTKYWKSVMQQYGKVRVFYMTEAEYRRIYGETAERRILEAILNIVKSRVAEDCYKSYYLKGVVQRKSITSLVGVNDYNSGFSTPTLESEGSIESVVEKSLVNLLTEEVLGGGHFKDLTGLLKLNKKDTILYQIYRDTHVAPSSHSVFPSWINRSTGDYISAERIISTGLRKAGNVGCLLRKVLMGDALLEVHQIKGRIKEEKAGAIRLLEETGVSKSLATETVLAAMHNVLKK